ncbi:hypothetical protein WMY93_023738 [Mugilogobius chulae]|uniref:AP-3 complex subunit beta n=1 Tax=Mugilogobius chulae TaxID=88201 RepID=A0AAW0NEZ9_9GOBI
MNATIQERQSRRGKAAAVAGERGEHGEDGAEPGPGPEPGGRQEPGPVSGQRAALVVQRPATDELRHLRGGGGFGGGGGGGGGGGEGNQEEKSTLEDGGSGGGSQTQPLRHDDLKEMLDSNKDSLKLEAMKRIVAMIARGKNASDLFPAVVKNVACKNIEVKKLVYVYLVRYAEEQQDLALLSISTFQRGLKLVAGSVVMAFEEVCPERIDLIHKNYRKLCNLLIDVEEWGQVVIINMLTRYARTQFLNPNINESLLEEGNTEGKTFYGSDEDEDEDEEEKEKKAEAMAKRKPYVMDPDHRLLLRNTKPLLQSRNAAVVMAVAQLYFHLAPKAEVGVIAKALVRLLRSHSEVQFVVLQNVATMTIKRRGMFEPYLKSFYIRSTDPTQIKILKLEVLTNLANETNISTILREFQTYIKSMDKDFVAATIQAIGRCATNIGEVRDTCLNGLVQLLSNRDELVVAESVVVIKKLLQMQPEKHSDIIKHMAKLIDNIQVPMARASILWLIGEYCEHVPKIAPDVLRKMAKSFTNEEDIVKLQILNLAAKLYLTNSKQTKLLTQYVLNLAKYDQNYDIRDRARFIRQLIVPTEKSGALSKYAKKLFLALKPAPVLESPFKESDSGSASGSGSGSEESGSGSESEESDEGSESEEEEEEEEPKRSKKKIQEVKKPVHETESDQSSEEERKPQRKPKSRKMSESESESEESESESSESESDESESEPETRKKKKVESKPSKPVKKETKKESKKEMSLLDLDDFEPAVSPQTTPVSAFMSNSLVTDLEGLSLSDDVLAPAVRQFIYISPSSSMKTFELLHRITGEGLSVSTASADSHPLHEQLSSDVTNLHVEDAKLQSGMRVKEFPEIESLAAGETTTAVMGIDFCDSTQAANFQLCTNSKKFFVSIQPPVGELMRPVFMTENEFKKEQGQLMGMNEITEKLTLDSKCRNEHAIVQRVTTAANLSRVPCGSDNECRFAARTVTGNSLVLVTVATKQEGGAQLTVNCDKMVIGTMLVKEILQALTQ